MNIFHNLRNQRGFTVVELLIVIVVIAILAALVLNTFSGVQQRARDTERETDVKAIATQLEAYYNGDLGQGSYPATLELATATPATNDTWAQTNLKGIDLNAMRAPGTAANSMTAATNPTATTAGVLPQPTKDQYVYQPLDGSNALCTAAATICTKFSIFWLKENGTAVQMKSSLNQ